MQKLDSEKFRAVLEAIAADKAEQRKGAAARPSSRKPERPFQRPISKCRRRNKASMVEFKRGLAPPFLVLDDQ